MREEQVSCLQWKMCSTVSGANRAHLSAGLSREPSLQKPLTQSVPRTPGPGPPPPLQMEFHPPSPLLLLRRESAFFDHSLVQQQRVLPKHLPRLVPVAGDTEQTAQEWPCPPGFTTSLCYDLRRS